MRISVWCSDVCSSDLDERKVQAHAYGDEEDAKRQPLERLCHHLDLGAILRLAKARRVDRDKGHAPYRQMRLYPVARGTRDGSPDCTVPFSDRKSVVYGKRVAVPVDTGGRRNIK